MTLAATLAAAAVIGLLLGLLGGGGSILALPVLIYLAGQEPQPAIAMSLFVVAATSAVAVIPHARAGRVHWRTGLVFGGAGLAGAYAGGRLAGLLPASLLLVGFGLMMAGAAVVMIRSCRRPMRAGPRSPHPAALLGLGAAVGMITGMVGAGGGFIIVPVLVLLAGLTMTSAIGTSLLIITLQAAAGLLGHLQHAHIDWPLTLAVTTLAIGGSLLGARLTSHIPARLLRTTFGWFLTSMAALVLLQLAPPGIHQALAGTPAGRVAIATGCAVLALAAARHITACRSLAHAPGRGAG